MSGNYRRLDSGRPRTHGYSSNWRRLETMEDKKLGSKAFGIHQEHKKQWKIKKLRNINHLEYFGNQGSLESRELMLLTQCSILKLFFFYILGECEGIT